MEVRQITVKRLEVPDYTRFLTFPKTPVNLALAPVAEPLIEPFQTEQAPIVCIGDTNYIQTDGEDLKQISEFIYKLKRDLYNVRSMCLTGRHKADSFQVEYLRYATASFWQRLKYLFKGTL